MPADAPPTRWVKSADGWREAPVDDSDDSSRNAGAELQVKTHEMHGQCYGFESERNSWVAPRVTYLCDDLAARPGYDSMSATEYRDDEAVLHAKVRHVARLVRIAECAVVYAGAGLSTAAGIGDYASQTGAAGVAAGAETTASTERLKSPMCAQPTLSHRVPQRANAYTYVSQKLSVAATRLMCSGDGGEVLHILGEDPLKRAIRRQRRQHHLSQKRALAQADDARCPTHLCAIEKTVVGGGGCVGAVGAGRGGINWSEQLVA